MMINNNRYFYINQRSSVANYLLNFCLFIHNNKSVFLVIPDH